MKNMIFRRALPVLMLILAGGWLNNAEAAVQVYGRYLEKKGTEIRIELEVTAPAPPLVIVVQSLPPGVQVVESRPESKLADPGRGQVKWLLSGLTPGKHQLLLKLDRPVASEAGGGEVRYRDPVGGSMLTRPLD